MKTVAANPPTITSIPKRHATDKILNILLSHLDLITCRHPTRIVTPQITFPSREGYIYIRDFLFQVYSRSNHSALSSCDGTTNECRVNPTTDLHLHPNANMAKLIHLSATVNSLNPYLGILELYTQFQVAFFRTR